MSDKQQAAAVQAIEVGVWKAGFHDPSGKAIMAFEFSDRPMMLFALELPIARAIGEALLKVGPRVAAPEPDKTN